jgi:hypothetical protein
MIDESEEIEPLMPDGLEAAVIGTTLASPGRPVSVFVLDYRKCVEILMERDGMSEEDADEFLQFNTVGAWMGEGTPIFVDVRLAMVQRKTLEEFEIEKSCMNCAYSVGHVDAPCNDCIKRMHDYWKKG